MKVKIKVKYLIMGVTIVAFFLSVFHYVLHPKMEDWIISRNISSGNIAEGRERILYHIEKESPNRYELIEKYMIHPAAMNQYDVYVGPSMRQMNGSVSNRIFTREETIPYIYEYIHRENQSNNLTLLEAVDILVAHYRSEKDYSKINEILHEVISDEELDEYYYHELKLREIEQAIDFQYYEDAKEMLDSYEKELTDRFPDFRLRYATLKGEWMLNSGKVEEAKTYLKEQLKIQEKRVEERDATFSDFESDSVAEVALSDNPYYEELELVHNSLSSISDSESLSSIEGRVITSEGAPMSDVGVFLRDESIINRSVGAYERFQTVTGPDGSFSFDSVTPGSYQITLGFLYDQIDGWSWPVEMDEWIDVRFGENIAYDVELSPLIDIYYPANDDVIFGEDVTFSWSKVPEASTYTISMAIEYDGGSISSPVITGIEESEITVPLEYLYEKTVGLSFSNDEWTSINPESILAFANVNGKFSWSVNAYDQKGKLLGQSEGYRLREETMGELPFFQLKSRKMTDADEMLMSGKLEEALEMYKYNVENDSDDLHSLRMVTRINGLDAERAEETFYYRKKLAEHQPTADNLFQVFEYYYFTAENMEEAYKWFHKYLEVEQQRPGPYVESLYGVLLTRLGKLEESRNYLSEVIKEDPSNRFIGYWLALELYFEQDMEDVWTIADSYRERGYDAVKWPSLVKELEKVDPVVVKEAVRLFLLDEKEKLRTYLLNKGEEIQQFIHALENVR
ncbi:carboxypeptidase-like regulatory domain-containing protein [Evansella tamaricis]|uniref:Carboxypeptidase-like regulatory domain-containing protein n=1 Tax=Evansella tamaricis TaxID=2069301 RepID=A0ABS6JJ11_9BACI|nr:carboxypeptidase-like regulatory domain-containing protein [Evansella tamaricis]MBU9713650.1 carboxypeptidase-like regulatory domain-containing protein [Evansella tamaricis]